jgi:class 3 adenylate cyclase/tetratricopeptide (TPR) repeat protein
MLENSLDDDVQNRNVKTGDVQQWLAGLGFEHLAATFEENAVDWVLLPEINNEDLKDLGVTRLADRKKLLAAIAKLGVTVDPSSATANLQPAAENLAVQNVPAEAEFRLLTVMFCDMVGSTALSTSLDPEQLRSIIARFQRACAEAVEPLGGFVARYMGDGVLVYFGYPRANENDAERAVSAGLAVTEACRLATDYEVRVGIASGRVIVGDLLGHGPVQERTVVGETPNLAARLQALAGPGSVVVSDTTRRLAGGGFDFDDFGTHKLKGFNSPVNAWRVLGTRAIASRFESNRNSALNPLFGRNTELMLLLDRWELACGGEGQAVFVSGEAGIGKSRLVEGLRHEVANFPHISFRYQCSPHFSTSAFYPVISQLQRAAKIETGDTVDLKLDKLETLLKKSTISGTSDAQIFAHLLSLPAEHRYGKLDLTPQEIKTRTLEVLLNQVFLLAEKEPVLFLVEDTHWIDPASEEFLELFIGRLEQSRVLLVVTHRSDWQPNLLGHNNISSLQLNRLGKSSCASIVRAVAGDFISEDVVDRIVSRTDGIPLFIEELTKSLVEGGLDIAEADIPATLQASLLARIDRLSPQAKEIVQIAAVIGREVPAELLEAVAKDKLNSLNVGVKQLVQTEFLFQSGTPKHLVYTFKHGLVQDSIYENMLSDVRQQQHQNVAEALVQQFPQIVETAPELVAHHYTEAACDETAITYWHRAGKRSAGRSADAESVAQLRRGISIIEQLPGTAERLQQNLTLHMDLTGPLIAIGGYGSGEMDNNTQRALDLAEQAGETDRIFPVLYGKFVFQLHTGLVGEALRQATEFLSLAERVGQHETIVQGQRIVGFANLIGGRPQVANQHLSEAARYEAPESGGSMPSVYGQDIEAAAKVLAAWTRLHCGYPEQAIELFDQALARAEHIDHANTLGVVLFHGGNMFVSLRMPDRVRQTLAGLRALNEKHDLSLWRVAESIVQPGLMSLVDEHRQVIDLIEPVLKVYKDEMHMRMHIPYMLAQSASALLSLQQPDLALTTAKSGLAESAESGAQIEDPELLRIVAIACMQLHGRSTSTDQAFEQALETARAMRMKWYELRIATDYAKYLKNHGDKSRARDLLLPLEAQFSEGRGMPDRISASEVIASLS